MLRVRVESSTSLIGCMTVVRVFSSLRACAWLCASVRLTGTLSSAPRETLHMCIGFR